MAVLGLAYKPDTPEVEQSQGIQLCERLKALGFDVYAHDPQANGSAAQQLDGIATIADNSAAALARAETVIIVTPWQEYGVLDFSGGNQRLVDPWGIFDVAQLPEAMAYIPMGRMAK